MEISHFIWLEEDLEAVQATIPDDDHCRIRGIRKLHQIITKPNKRNGLFIREYACLCNVCIKGRVESCQAAESNQYFRHNIDVLKAKWYQFNQIDSGKDNGNEEHDEIDLFIENVTKYIVKGDLTIIRAGGDYKYYLAKLITNIYETEESQKNDYNHELPAHQKVIACSYLKVHKDIKEGILYYIEQKRKAVISTYCITGVCPTLEICQEKHCGSMEDMSLVTHDTNEAILSLLSEQIM